MRKTLFHILSFAMVASVLLAACATPTPQVVIQTAAPVIQTQVVVQTAAPVVEVQTQVVEKQVTQVVEKQVEVTAAPQPTVAMPPTATPFPLAKVESGKIPIYWYIGLGTGTNAEQMPIQQEVVADFNSQPERATDKIQLIMQVVPNASARDALATMIAASNGPDIVGPVGWSGANTFFGQWLDLTPYVKATNYDLTQFDPALVKAYQSEQGLAGLPFAVFPSAIFYNTKLFDEAGLNYPPAKYGEQYKMPDGTMVDWSWDTVAKVGKLLTIDSAGKNSTEAGFDKTKIVQYGFDWQWEGTATYVGSFWQAGEILVPGGSKGQYKAQIPDTWKVAWKWTYDGVWGDQPYIMNGQVFNSADFGSGNVFQGGKVGMIDQPLWFTCCIDPKSNNTWDFGAMPTYNGKVGGRLDADTFRIWKGTAHPKEAFTVLQYLIGPAVQKLVVGSADKPSAYGAFPGRTADQANYISAKNKQFPWVKNWDTVLAGLAYADVPSAESWVPNFNEYWNRSTNFYTLMQNTSGLDLNAEIEKFRADSETIFNK